MSKTVIPLPVPQPQPLTDAVTLGKFVRARRTQAGMTIHEAGRLLRCCRRYHEQVGNRKW